jgi:hypothetical protein
MPSSCPFDLNSELSPLHAIVTTRFRRDRRERVVGCSPGFPKLVRRTLHEGVLQKFSPIFEMHAQNSRRTASRFLWRPKPV